MLIAIGWVILYCFAGALFGMLMEGIAIALKTEGVNLSYINETSAGVVFLLITALVLVTYSVNRYDGHQKTEDPRVLDILDDDHALIKTSAVRIISLEYTIIDSLLTSLSITGIAIPASQFISLGNISGDFFGVQPLAFLALPVLGIIIRIEGRIFYEGRVAKVRLFKEARDYLILKNKKLSQEMDGVTFSENGDDSCETSQDNAEHKEKEW